MPKIMLLGNNKELLFIIKEYFSSVHCDVALIDCAKAALGVARKWWPDVIISDLDLPGGASLELARHFHQQGQGVLPLLVAYSGKTGPGERESAIRAGFDYFVARPLSIKMLASIALQGPSHANQSARLNKPKPRQRRSGLPEDTGLRPGLSHQAARLQAA